MPTRPKHKLSSLNLSNETIGQRIARLRNERGFTQKELSGKIGIICKLVSDYERGRIRLYDEMVTRFALALEVSTDDILGLKNKKYSKTNPSLRIMRRLKRIETLPQSDQKFILKTIDSLLKATEQ